MSFDWNTVVDALAEQVAAKVVQRLSEKDGSNWPAPVETPVEEFVRTFDKVMGGQAPALATEFADDPGDEEVTPEAEPEDEVVKPMGEKERRIEHWENTDIRKIRKLLANAEGFDLSKYKSYSKADLAKYAADFESVVGKHLEDFPNENSKDTPAEDVPDPDTPVQVDEESTEAEGDEEELTYEEALTLDLAELKQIALDNGFSSDELNGLDVDAVADLLFAEETAYSTEDIMQMDRGTLEQIAGDHDIEYDEHISRPDLALKIIDKLG